MWVNPQYVTGLMDDDSYAAEIFYRGSLGRITSYNSEQTWRARAINKAGKSYYCDNLTFDDAVEFVEKHVNE